MTPLWESPELDRLLAADIAGAPADAAWRREFSPELSYGRHAGPARSDARLAAVALVLCWDGREWSLPLTVRCESLRRHAGQVSLPGGLIEIGESARVAARRELSEELGREPPIDWLGELDALLVYASNALVTPCVARISGWPDWRPQPTEVDRILRLSVRELMEQPPTDPLIVERGPLHFSAPRLMVEGCSVWGATAVLLGELRGRLQRISQTHLTPDNEQLTFPCPTSPLPITRCAPSPSISTA